MGRPLKSVFKKEHRDDIANRSANPVFSEVAEVFLSRRRFLGQSLAAAFAGRSVLGQSEADAGLHSFKDPYPPFHVSCCCYTVFAFKDNKKK